MTFVIITSLRFYYFIPLSSAFPHMSVSSTVQRDRRHNRHVQVGRPAQPLCRSISPPPTWITTKTTANSVSYAQHQLGVSLSEGLKKAYNECKTKVERIAAQCRVKNRKFRYKHSFVLFPLSLHLALLNFFIEMSNSISKTTQAAVYITSWITIFLQLLTSDESLIYLKILFSSAVLQNQLKLFKERWKIVISFRRSQR